jgi:hypothetical protein
MRFALVREVVGMRVSIEASVRTTQRGVLAQCKKLRLTGGGHSEAEAIASLRRGVTAWCTGLERQHALDDALQRRGIQWTADDGPLVVEVHRSGEGEEMRSVEGGI